MKIFNHSQSQANQTGFTLMEVLISMTIGLVILVAALQFFGRGVRALQTGDAYARMHEAASSAGAILSRDIQLAGFYGYGGSANEISIIGTGGYQFANLQFSPAHPSVVGLGNAFPNECGAEALVALARPIEFYPSNTEIAAANIPATCFPLKADDPALILRGALDGTAFTDNITELSTAYNDSVIYVTASPFAGFGQPAVIYFFGNPPGVTSSNAPDFSLARAFQAQFIKRKRSGDMTPIFPYSFRAYYIRGCNDFDTALNICNDTIPERTLVRQQLVPGNPNNAPSVDLELVPLIPGVEQMRFFWGVDSRGAIDNRTGDDIGDGVTDFWTTNPTDFNKINVVRIQMLIRSGAPEGGYNDSDATYFFDQDTTGFQCTGEGCRFRRMIYETATSVRNCSLRRRSGVSAVGDC